MARDGRKFANEALIMALGCGATKENAAKKAGVGVRTLYRRLDDPAFVERLNRFGAEMLKRAADMLTAAALEAVRTLLDLQKPGMPPAARLGAARAVLELGIRLRESNELHERITALEEQFGPKIAAA